MSAFDVIDANALASWVLQTGTMVALLLGLVLLIRRPFAKAFGARATYALWAIPALRLFMPSLTWPAILTPNWARPETPMTVSDITAPTFAYRTDMAITETVRVGPVVQPPTPTDAAQGLDIAWTPVLLTLWLSVAIIWVVLQLWRQQRWMGTLTQHTDPVPDTLWSDIELACEKAGLRDLPAVRMSRDGLGPCVTGLFRPVVLLPDSFPTHYTSEQRQLALIHELAHIKRGDLLAALGALLFRAVNWPNPLVHYAVKRFRLDQEAACDATVIRMVGHRAATQPYAETLVHAAKSSQHSQTGTPLNLAMSTPSPASTFRA